MRRHLVALVIIAASAQARAEFLQKTVRQFALDDRNVPPAVLEASVPKPWLHVERGPVPDLKLFASDRDSVCWLGGPEGAAQFDPRAKNDWDRWQFFSGPRWLKDNLVKGVFVDEPEPPSNARRVWIRTDTGVSLIEWKAETLAGKAAHYEDLIERHHLRHGFVADCRLREPGNLETSFTTDNDNDGLWTAMYLAAESYRYATTGEREARARATRAFDAIVRLLDITGHLGFPARSFVAAKETHGDGEWHPTADGQWIWKGDTSSDELVGHYYGHALFYDLVADESQKATVRRVIRAITDHLIERDYDLIDLDRRPTRWGQWSERYFATEEGRYERALRSLELLSFLRTAHHITGEEKYEQAYRERVGRGYAGFIREYRRWPGGGEINFSDDELAYLSIDPLLRYEGDPKLRREYLDSVRFIWGEVRPDRNPLWNFISGASDGGRLPLKDGAESIQTLERIPWLPIEWSVRNSQRTDVRMRPATDRFQRRELIETLAPDERPPHKWNGNPYVPDGGAGGHSLECGTYFLLPYWMGRYHGWIKE